MFFQWSLNAPHLPFIPEQAGAFAQNRRDGHGLLSWGQWAKGLSHIQHLQNKQLPHTRVVSVWINQQS